MTIGMSLFDHFDIGILFLAVYRLIAGGGLVFEELGFAIEVCFRNKQDLGDKDEGEHCEADPEDVAVIECPSDIATCYAANEGPAGEKYGVDGLRDSVSSVQADVLEQSRLTIALPRSCTKKISPTTFAAILSAGPIPKPCTTLAASNDSNESATAHHALAATKITIVKISTGLRPMMFDIGTQMILPKPIIKTLKATRRVSLPNPGGAVFAGRGSCIKINVKAGATPAVAKLTAKQ